jgi:uncharacterized repeat protein (TIGR03987 family)
MDSTLSVAIVFINLAMLFYTLGVWAERIQLRLKWWHTALFWSGVVADTIGTGAMAFISGSLFKLSFHGITGNIALALMLFHAIWATSVLIRKQERLIVTFHRFSLFVWVVWLIPMVTGGVLGMV